ncbi:MAG TPA: threonine--tRNA ligase [Candidatus Moranbacteria bacterium]|nr:threonine--tRNA ligase [Candidatus Moranbacteria bacterium]HAT74533.1 threonine--tRNA ligase [Candidatus Moranbacteria bacterium]
MPTKTNHGNLEILRHSTAHVLATAVLEMFPEAKFGIGPAIENGFYYDFELPRTLIPEDLAILEEKMRAIIKTNYPFERAEISVEEARKDFEKLGQDYKLELIEDIAKNQLTNKQFNHLTIYKSGPFVDLCSGPHLESTGEINYKALKLTKISGAYWRGDEKNKQLQRIYGVAFETKKELDEYLKMLEEAEKRDHRKLGQELELFMFSEEIGKGLPLWLPKGAFIRKKLEDYMYELERQNGYNFVYTPVLANEKLYNKSGHLAHYKEDMYNPIDIEGEKYYLKPMNCPHHHIIYKNKMMSYRDLPVRFSDFSPLHRFERSGVLTGLIRARCFSQNDSHIYCAQEQIKDELKNILDLFKKVYADFNIKNYWFRLSLPDFNNTEKFGDIENKEIWKKSAEFARQALIESKEKFIEAEGEAAFYGPKIDVQIKNVHGKEDTIATMQVDFYMPERFNLEFINSEGKKERPVIIHKAIMGSFDRFFAFLVEQTAGAFPVWLSPVQAVIIPISEEKFGKYANFVETRLIASDIRATVDNSKESLGKRIREAEKQKIPYILVVGEKEEKENTVAIRQRGKEGEQETLKIKEFIEKIKKEIHEKK